MSLEDLSPHIVLISLFLKCIVLVIIIIELVLPKMKTQDLRISWRTDWETEIGSALIEGSSFLFSIGLLVVFDIIAAEESWIPLPVAFTIDILLMVMILSLLFSPKQYGVTGSGIYRQGLVLGWDHIIDIDPAPGGLNVRTRGIIRENRKYPLPEGAEKREEILAYIRTRIKGEGKNGSGPEDEEKTDSGPEGEVRVPDLK